MELSCLHRDKTADKCGEQDINEAWNGEQLTFVDVWVDQLRELWSRLSFSS